MSDRLTKALVNTTLSLHKAGLMDGDKAMTIVKDLGAVGQQALWSAYCDKKQECEVLKDKLKECFEMLHYSHFTCEQWYDYEKVSKYLKEMEAFLNAANK